MNGKVRAAPALLDSLCVVYNKKLFAAGRRARRRRPGWTWDDFVTTAQKLTNPGEGHLRHRLARRRATRTRSGGSGR